MSEAATVVVDVAPPPFAELHGQPPPPLIYKFRAVAGPEGMRRAEGIVRGSRLYFSRSTSFNDPFDCSPVHVFEGPKRRREQFLNDMLKRRQPMSRPDRRRRVRWFLELPIKERDDYLRMVIEDTVASIALCSFAGNCQSTLLWSHYADSHKGVAFGFSTTPRMKSPFSFAWPVTYTGDRPRVDMSEAGQGGDAISMIRRCLLMKAAEWEYESEWRLIELDTEPGEYPFPPPFLDRIVFGALCPPETITEICSWLVGRPSPVRLFKADLARDRYAIHVSDLR